MVWARDGGEFDVGRRREGENNCKIYLFLTISIERLQFPPVVPPVEPWVQPRLTVKMHKRGGSTGGWRGGSTGGQGENAVTDSICRSIFLCPLGNSNSGLNVETWIAGPKRWLFIPGNSSAWAVKILVRKIWAQWLRVVRSQIYKKKDAGSQKWRMLYKKIMTRTIFECLTGGTTGGRPRFWPTPGRTPGRTPG